MCSSNLTALRESFGISFTDGEVPKERSQPTIPAAGITFVTGTSGAGKSTFLRALEKNHPQFGTLVETLPSGVPLVDLLEKPLSETISWFGRFGLGDARILARPCEHLSEGQKFRARLALSLAAGMRFILVDEFLSLVDRPSAKVVAHNFQKICREMNITAIVATAHDDLIEFIRPDCIVRFHLGGNFTTHFFENIEQPEQMELLSALGVTVTKGGPDDFAALKSFHYVDDEDNHDEEDKDAEYIVARAGHDIAAVCVWRKPFSETLERIPAIRLMNEKILHRHRTIVHPSYRSLGLTRLLDTEAVQNGKKIAVATTAMGKHFPFHLSAGYTADNEGQDALGHRREELTALLGSLGIFNLSEMHQTKEAAKALVHLNAQQRHQLCCSLSGILAERSVLWTQFLCRLSGTTMLGESQNEQFRQFYKRIFLKRIEDDTALADLLGEGIGFDMAVFHKNASGKTPC